MPGSSPVSVREMPDGIHSSRQRETLVRLRTLVMLMPRDVVLRNRESAARGGAGFAEWRWCKLTTADSGKGVRVEICLKFGSRKRRELNAGTNSGEYLRVNGALIAYRATANLAF